MSGFVEPVALAGQRWVALEPLAREHIPEITAAAADGELGSLWFTSAPKATVVYSILDIEWPAVHNNLRYRLDRNG